MRIGNRRSFFYRISNLQSLGFAYRRLCLYSFPLWKGIPAIQSKEKVKIALLGKESVREICLRLAWIDKKILCQRLDRGDNICVAYRNSDILSYCWITFNQILVDEIQMTLKIKDHEVYLYDAYTKPEHRGKGLYPAILTNLLSYSKQKDFSRALIFVRKGNKASHSGIIKAGFIQFQELVFIKLVGLALYILKEIIPEEEEVCLIPNKQEQ